MDQKQRVFQRRWVARAYIIVISIWALVIPKVYAVAGGNNWMATIKDSTPLTLISIPGTHDSCALHEPLTGTAKCQNLDISGQLNAGVRFLDIRCDNTGKAFSIYHGIYPEGMTFTQVLTEVTSFLQSNPSETVIMSIKEENSQTGRAFNAVFNAYVARNPNLWFLGSSIPSLGTVRGKIILLRRFEGSGGIDASVWPDNATFTNGNMLVEDDYNIAKVVAKWISVFQHLNTAKSGDASSLYVTFTSGYIPETLGLPNITAVSSSINSNLTTYFNSNGPGRYGIIPMDFVDAAHCSQIIAKNASQHS